MGWERDGGGGGSDPKKQLIKPSSSIIQLELFH